MNKKIIIILAVLSLLIICFGFIASMSIQKQIINEVIPTENVYFDGENVTSATQLLGSIAAGLLGFAFIIYSLLIVVGIWIIYLVVFLIVKIVKKIKKRKANNN